ncbi:VOC family protein [Rhabdothermincola salaria]|uniref:VOC family protein n=1 Tax=Rhabdothermincola salaria TaxID=2903142 RepID=UPI001E2BBE67|nr:VOC family protein [Rhabdothermincola salaria]MCD9625683.1 VOC family protein [Rhabdothermincola salaria]
MQPLGVHHVSINVSDPARSLVFYTGVLGARVRDDRPDFSIGGAWLDMGSTQVHLIEASVPPAQGQHFALLLDDLDAVVDELRAKGIEVDDPKVVGPDRQTFVHDPDGNAIELHQIGTAGRS